MYKEGFSAVGFNCDNENFRTGVVNLSDALSFILDITLQGKQVKMINLFFAIHSFYNLFNLW